VLEVDPLEDAREPLVPPVLDEAVPEADEDDDEREVAAEAVVARAELEDPAVEPRLELADVVAFPPQPMRAMHPRSQRAWVMNRRLPGGPARGKPRGPRHDSFVNAL
jgi:hypothetical protein